jgi:hypothetical protein
VSEAKQAGAGSYLDGPPIIAKMIVKIALFMVERAIKKIIG